MTDAKLEYPRPGWDEHQVQAVRDMVDWNYSRVGRPGHTIELAREVEFNYLVNWTFWPDPQLSRRPRAHVRENRLKGIIRTWLKKKK